MTGAEIETWSLGPLEITLTIITMGRCINDNNNNNSNNNNNKSHISHDKTWTWLRKGIFKRETESLLIAAQNDVRTNRVKARMEKTQQNSKCSLCGDRDVIINHIISECSKLAQKEYKTRRARNLNLTIRTNGICTTQHLS